MAARSEKRLLALGIRWFKQVAPKLDTVPDRVRVRRENWMAHSRQLHHEKYGEWLAEYKGRGPLSQDEAPNKPRLVKKKSSRKVATGAEPDDLKLIHGVGPVLEKRLHSLGITTFAEIAE